MLKKRTAYEYEESKSSISSKSESTSTVTENSDDSEYIQEDDEEMHRFLHRPIPEREVKSRQKIARWTTIAAQGRENAKEEYKYDIATKHDLSYTFVDDPEEDPEAPINKRLLKTVEIGNPNNINRKVVRKPQFFDVENMLKFTKQAIIDRYVYQAVDEDLILEDVPSEMRNAEDQPPQMTEEEYEAVAHQILVNASGLHIRSQP